MALVQVQPGNVTGIFYILVANLPWNCSWQRLKDFARNQQSDGTCIEIDHAHVYPDGTTSGWVRVKGKKNFFNAMGHLTTGIMDHRSLVVEGRNETEVTPIKEDGLPGLGASRRTRHDSSSSCETFPSPTGTFSRHRNNSSVSTYSGSEGWYGQPYHGSTTSLPSPTSPNISYFQSLPQVYESYSSVSTYPLNDYFQAPAPSDVVYSTNMVMTTPVYVTPAPQTPAYTYTSPTPYLEAPFSPQTSVYSVKTEARKIIITQLPHSTTYHDLEKLLFKCITRSVSRSSPQNPDSQLEEIDIALHSDKKPRGHAFAVLRSEQLARSVAKSLDGVQFQGRIIKARLAKEGVKTPSPIIDAPRLMSPPLEYQYQDTPEAQPAIEDYSTRTSAATAPRADNKSRKAKESSSDKRKKSSSPAVVNGSSSGSSHERDEKSKKYRS